MVKFMNITVKYWLGDNVMKRRKRLLVLLCGMLTASIFSGCIFADKPAKIDPTAVVVWHYYNGAQQHLFENLVDEFNAGVGLDQNIVVEAHSYGSVGDLKEKVMGAICKDVGAEEPPDVFAAYADTAYEVDGMGRLAELSQYLTQEEQDRYLSPYLDEGRFDMSGFHIFPVAKSTEVLSVNWTQWKPFAAETGVSEDQLSTWEGIASVAERYYQWTDEQTPEIPEDGKAFFGRDAFANYMIIGSRQLGVELFQVENGKVTLQMDRTVMRRLWDNYYVPYINGYYAAYSKFRSDDMRTGDIAAFVGSTSGATYFPTEVTEPDGSSRPIEGKVFALPNFQDTKPCAVQQGAGMVVSRSNEKQERAAVTFLKWMTQPEQNVRFAMDSGYMPVTYEGNQLEGKRVMEREGNLGKQMCCEIPFYWELKCHNHTPFIQTVLLRMDMMRARWWENLCRRRPFLTAWQ